MNRAITRSRAAVEWPTLLVTLGCYAAWLAATAMAATIGLMPAILVTALTITLHSSLQHETIHGHPLPSRRLSEGLVFPALGLVQPYGRFRDSHLAHHRTANLTDPLDDPESNHLVAARWAALPWPCRAVLAANNTLLGRFLIGPAMGTLSLAVGDVRALLRGERGIAAAWAWHGLALLPVLAWLAFVATLPFWAYLVAAYLGMSILRVRTFLEHQPHDDRARRSVIIEDRGPLAFLFLNNNLHAVHHAYPGAPWYRLPALYRRGRDVFLRRNGGYRYGSYREIARRHLLSAKDPVVHPDHRRQGTA
ncbi:MAG: fatty acid desaturase [Azospirillaceae bacterium]